MYAGLVVIGAALGIGATVGIPAADAEAPTSIRTAATVAIDALTSSSAEDARTSIPAGFAGAFYSPTIENGLLVNPDGGCSSPIPLPHEFDTACKAHDLGYDLLRFGSAAGAPSTREARKALDTQLAERTHDTCTSRSGIGSRTLCYTLSTVASDAVEFNSWRQRFAAPSPEPMLPYLIASGLGVGALMAASCSVSIAAPLRAERRRAERSRARTQGGRVAAA
ncbi:hypothetical protein QMK17_01445 [Rhodococcus sp. G-MC3]|uniref:hypothetical protein n=1 Tax=Rhodococcus sp. G-MC3 TaxID=3046209 RepID=UPI0024BA7D43|nr:hypothetical protein [Rhodococcus sp. G-MC3]MDJ0391995.1 hypothetical protein [Rhodococcus sp. G-MC3]